MTFEEWWDDEFIAPGSAIGLDRSFALAVWNAAYFEGTLARSSAMDWQPIETAPRDGRRFLFTNSVDVVGTGYFINGSYFAADSWQGSTETRATHWMPLPEPPK